MSELSLSNMWSAMWHCEAFQHAVWKVDAFHWTKYSGYDEIRQDFPIKKYFYSTAGHLGILEDMCKIS